MDNLPCNKAQPAMRKLKKKQGKGEMDRVKQAEKKKRRLEKALATSAAICSELEKKKQRKKEEQQRLDQEGAAIAEAAALHVLLGEDTDDDDDDDDDKFEDATAWNCAGSQECALEGIEWISGSHASIFRWSGFGGGEWPSPSPSPSPSGPYIEEGCGWSTTEVCPGLIAAQAVSSLQIRDDAHVDTIFLDEVLRG